MNVGFSSPHDRIAIYTKCKSDSQWALMSAFDLYPDASLAQLTAVFVRCAISTGVAIATATTAAEKYAANEKKGTLPEFVLQCASADIVAK